MGPPPIQLFLTTIASQITLRQRQEYILRVLQVKQIPFTSYDLASDEDAKKLWRRKAPKDKQQLPGILVGGKFPGTFEQFEEAVEFNELDIFLSRKEEWKPFEDEKELLRAEPIGVPGAYSPLQMYPKHAPSRSPSPSPLAVREKEKKQVPARETLADLGLQDLDVSMDDLKALVAELGLGGEDAKDLVKGLAGDMAPTAKSISRKASSQEVNTVPFPQKKDAPKSRVVHDEDQDPSIVKVSPPEDTSTDVAAEAKAKTSA